MLGVISFIRRVRSPSRACSMGEGEHGGWNSREHNGEGSGREKECNRVGESMTQGVEGRPGEAV